jgi:hypothetical protein
LLPLRYLAALALVMLAVPSVATPFLPRNTEIHAAELQVWSSKPDVDGASVD